MATPEGARSAIQALNGKAMGTCTLTVSEAWLHEQRTSSPGGVEVPASFKPSWPNALKGHREL